MHPLIPLTYIVDINSTDPDTGMNFRNVASEMFLLVNFLEEFLTGEECLVIEFSVSAENVAGVGDSAAIIDTVPLCELTSYSNINRGKCTSSYLI